MKTPFNISNCTNRLFLTANSFNSILPMFGKSFSLLSLLSLFAIGLSTTTIQAADDDGGFVVMIQGLTDKDIIVELNPQKTGYKNTIINISILAADGTLVFKEESTASLIDLSSISLPAGNYTMNLQVEQFSETITFIK